MSLLLSSPDKPFPIKKRDMSEGLQSLSPTGAGHHATNSEDRVIAASTSNSNFQDAVESHNEEEGDTSTARRASRLRRTRFVQQQQQQRTAMGERPLGFKLATYAKKISRRQLHGPGPSSGVGHPHSTRSAPTTSTNAPSTSSHWRTPTEESLLLLPTASDAISELASGDENDEEEEETLGQVLREIFFGKLVSIFLLCAPFCFLAKHLEWSATTQFWLNFLTMIPLAAILGDFTEEVALHTNQVIGGLINATFGNAVEVVVAIQALLQNEIRVVQASMIGSIFSNLLLVLGCCFFFGGLYHKEQSFNATAATANMSLLALSSVALVLPTPFAEYYDIQDERVLFISRTAAIFLMTMYLQLLLFQLKTHVDLFTDEDDDKARLSLRVGIVGLLVTTGLITIFSDMLVSSINGFVLQSGISRTFVGLILLPVVGNAVEHITAVTVAVKNKMDLAMGVALGSSVQISLFVVPFTVLMGWALDKDMTLNFPHFEILLYTFSVIIVSICLSNPKGNWLEGSLLITTYIMVAVGFYFEDVKDF